MNLRKEKRAQQLEKEKRAQQQKAGKIGEGDGNDVPVCLLLY